MIEWVIFASEVAALINRNPFVTRVQAVLKLLRRHCPDRFEESMLIKPFKSFDEEMWQQAMSSTVYDERKQIISNIVRNLSESNEDTVRQQDILSLVNISCGQRDENATIKAFETEHNKRVGKRNQYFYKKWIYYRNRPDTIRRFLIGGRVDGIVDDLPNTVLEVKNRQRQILNYVPPHEMIQVQIYMYLTKLKSCRLLESHGTESVVHDIPYDYDFVRDVLHVLRETVRHLNRLIDDDALQADLLIHQRFRLPLEADDDDLDSGSSSESSSALPLSTDEPCKNDASSEL